MTVDGKAREEIANEMVRLHADYYGRGPTRAKVYAQDDFVAVVLEETFTPAEKTLIARGEADGSRTFADASSESWRSSSPRLSSRAPGVRCGRF